MKTILILEDNADRIAAFERVIGTLGSEYELKVWRDAPSICAQAEEFFSTAALICLDHDLNPQPGATADPGTGLDVARFLGDFLPVCPVLIHSSNTERVWSMHNELRFAGWIVDQVGPLGADWIETYWVRHARELLGQHPNTWKVQLPPDHVSRVDRMSLSLTALGIGDALGEMFAYRPESAPKRLAENDLPAGPWFHTDDTEMAISIAGVLKAHGCIQQEALAKRFVRRFERDPERGYGSMTRKQMREILGGANWRDTAANAFGGQGSKGNGSAMRVAPVGAYFADDLNRCVKEAAASSVVTHTHPEGVAGAIAVALGTALVWQLKDAEPTKRAEKFFTELLRLTPEGEVRRGILLASQIPGDMQTHTAAKALGSGFLVTAPDTVPFCLWITAHHMDNFVQALSETIRVGGDCDTNAAIVAGMIALSVGRGAIPEDWIKNRETLNL